MSNVGAGCPLSGKTILVTRQREQATKLVELLKQNGAEVVLFPTIEIIPPDNWDMCDNALTTISMYDGIIFTSANAVRYFMSRTVEIHKDSNAALGKKSIFAVGKKTQEAVENYGLHATVLEGTYDSRTLGKQLSQLELNGKRFLFPRGSLARAEFLSALREQGAVVDEVIVYRTQLPLSIDSKPVEELLKKNGIDMVLFFSPSSITNFLSVIPRDLLTTARIAAIGRTTEEAAQAVKLRVDLVADEPTTEHLVTSIMQFYE